LKGANYEALHYDIFSYLLLLFSFLRSNVLLLKPKRLLGHQYLTI